MLEHDRDGDVCLKWDDLAEQYFTYRMSESEYFHYRENWWISLNKSGNIGGPLKKRSDFNQVLSTLNRFHRIWRTTTQAHAILEVPATATVIEFFFHLVAMEWIPVFLRIQRKSMKEDACKGLWLNGATRCLPIFGLKPQTNGFHEFNLLFSILLQIDRSQLTAVYCNRRRVWRQHLKRPSFTVWKITRNYKKFSFRWKVNTWEHWWRLN